MERCNFVVIFPDQWRGDCMSAVGHKHAKTLYTDNIASKGILFDCAYSACPTCVPARASLATGLNSDHTGRLGYADGVDWDYKDTLMEQLKNSGYQTMQVGKTHFYPQRAHLGFEEMRIYDVQRHHSGFESDYHKWLYEETGGSIEDTARELDPNTFAVTPWRHDEYYHPTNWTTRQAIELLQRQDPTRPFFLQVGYHRPHSPYDPPLYYYEQLKGAEVEPPPCGDWCPQYKEYKADMSMHSGKLREEQLAEMRRGYYASVTHLDNEIGKLFHFLNKNGLLKNTYVIILSDHGDMLGDHFIHKKAVPFEGSIKIPFIICPPKDVESPRGTVCHTPVCHTDVMPTILEAAGINPAYKTDGISLLPATRGETPERGHIHGEHANRTLGHGWQYLVDGKEKYAWETNSGREYYFDLVNDPLELHNAVNDVNKQPAVAALRQKMVEILSKRPNDGLVEDGKLRAGKILPPVRQN